ncbi:Uncharacterised protein [Mycobacteroides abscessus subsp. abscessus]|nr:Uncharacterised protein [Mycobacteroides abscessus subsp. abscessus]
MLAISSGSIRTTGKAFPVSDMPSGEPSANSFSVTGLISIGVATPDG